MMNKKVLTRIISGAVIVAAFLIMFWSTISQGSHKFDVLTATNGSSFQNYTLIVVFGVASVAFALASFCLSWPSDTAKDDTKRNIHITSQMQSEVPGSEENNPRFDMSDSSSR